MLTFESASVQGATAVVEKLVVRITPSSATPAKNPSLTLLQPQGLPFQKVKHQVATLDAQPSNENGGIIILVTGQLLV
ncbi:Nuclear transport factor 2 [Ilyonectria robusta]